VSSSGFHVTDVSFSQLRVVSGAKVAGHGGTAAAADHPWTIRFRARLIPMTGHSRWSSALLFRLRANGE
jgi:hypothetical protein